MSGSEPNILLDVAPAHLGPEVDPFGGNGDVAEPGHVAQINQEPRGGEPEGEERHEALAPCNRPRPSIGRQQGNGFVERRRRLVFERRWLHCLCSEGCDPEIRTEMIASGCRSYLV